MCTGQQEENEQAFLVLEDGTVLPGKPFGAIAPIDGEVGKFTFWIWITGFFKGNFFYCFAPFVLRVLMENNFLLANILHWQLLFLLRSRRHVNVNSSKNILYSINSFNLYLFPLFNKNKIQSNQSFECYILEHACAIKEIKLQVERTLIVISRAMIFLLLRIF